MPVICLLFRAVSLVLEPILKEPGDIAFTWLEIHRTKNTLLQQFDLQTNTSSTVTGSGGGAGTVGVGTASGGVVTSTGTSGNDTLSDFGFYPKESDCEYKCPEIDACIAAILWCDGKYNCYDDIQ